METTIASYQEPGIRMQLVEIKTEDIGSDGIPTNLTNIIYKIIVNRKIYYRTHSKEYAKHRMKAYIYHYLSQTEINYEEEQ